MAAPLSNHPFELIFTRPNCEDREGTRSKFREGFEIQNQHPDFIGVTIEGVGVEDRGLGMRIMQWTCAEGHMRFRASKPYADFTKVREGAYLSPPIMAHYNFTEWISQKPTPPVLEIMDITLKPDVAYFEWLLAFKPVIHSRKDAPGFLGYTIGRQLEDSRKVLVICGWQSLKANTDYFESENADSVELYKAADGFQGALSIFHIATCNPGRGV